MAGKLHDGTNIEITPLRAALVNVDKFRAIVQLGRLSLTFTHGQLTAISGIRTGASCLSGHEGDVEAKGFTPPSTAVVSEKQMQEMLVVELISIGVKQLDINDQVPLSVAVALATVTGE